jgi:V/A-type H+-transporting ATPase subunit E
MPGINAIVDRINADARAKADEVLSAAKAEAAQILGAANNEAAGIKSLALAAADKTRQERAAFLEARARREYSQGLLKAKREILSGVVDAAKAKAASAPVKEYFADIERWIAANAHAADGVLYMNNADTKRLPKDFVDNINKKLKGGSLVLKQRAIPSGCVLRYENDEYGAVEENGTLEARFDAKADALIDAAAAALGLSGIGGQNA